MYEIKANSLTFLKKLVYIYLNYNIRQGYQSGVGSVPMTKKMREKNIYISEKIIVWRTCSYKAVEPASLIRP